jgi:uncharacterized membrane protein
MVGPVEIVVLGFEGEADFTEIRLELERLRDSAVVRLIDLMAVRHREHGVIETVQLSDLGDDEAMAFGIAIGALIGLGAGGEDGMEAGAVWGMRQMEDGHLFDEDTSWALAERIPEGSSAVIALVEHRWRIPVRDAVRRAGGFPLAAGWLREEHLVAIGELIGLEEIEEGEDAAEDVA